MVGVRRLCDEIFGDIETVLLFSPTPPLYDSLITDKNDIEVVVISPENSVGSKQFVELPINFANITQRVRYGVTGAIDQGWIDTEESLLCATQLFNGTVDTLIHIQGAQANNSNTYNLIVRSRADHTVIGKAIRLALDLGKKGQKGGPVGALFVVGHAGQVMQKSRSLSYNPFERSHVHLGDPIIDIMVREFSELDGAFIISDTGKIVSCYRYLESAIDTIDIPKGLGTRHNAAAAITQETEAVTIVLSESDGLVRAFKQGKLSLELDPDEY